MGCSWLFIFGFLYGSRNIYGMAYKPPRTLAESEALLKGAADQDRAKDTWKTMVWIALLLVTGGIVLAALFLGLFGGSSVGPVVLVLFLLFLPFILNKKK